jgi:hypothetical protein
VSALRATEADWQATVIDYAHLRKWRVAHFRPAKTEQGWRTAVSADGAGFPDLVLVRDRVIFAELKSDTGKLSVAQLEWFLGLELANAEAYIWRPSDWPEVERVLL